ncbi:hypothetical protein RM697_08335 [Ichthyenterobacterium sp. W332]|uniref:DUF998 domain-containing protein n=1 Tax=Microcosmobacter mediterraneus TaxID=3075607 RepID=A0ABU2YKF1_9FLAO|nr:hypothetical protein [Ichthyenterobacterium sp. W332]MDT0558651.1 hypothetical protein [Ichthyenterobacterium sp. W332]
MQFKIQNYYTNDDKMFLVVESIIVAICMLIPCILIWVDCDQEIRGSISKYVNMCDSHIFGLMFGIAGTAFILNGALYFKAEDDEKLNPSIKSNYTIDETLYNKKKIGKWYNLVFGIALIGVAVFHYNRTDLSMYLHYASAIIFFAGSAVVMFFIHDPQDRFYSRTLAVGSLVCLAIGLFSDEYLSLFWAESIALWLVAIYYLVENRRIWVQN